jgi:Spy/CpxP family protein refolding chaperone
MEEFMKKYGMIMFFVLMIVLLVLPLTILAEETKGPSIMKPQEGEHMMRGPEGRMGHHDWLSYLNLDEKVIQKIQEMRLAHKEKMIELNSKIAKKELEFEKVLLEKELNFTKLLSVYDEISDLKQELERKKIEHKIEIYKLIPDDKKEEAKKIFLHKFLGKGHGKFGMQEKQDNPGCPMKK